MPDKKGNKFPVVLVIHEIFGVHEWIQDVCRRFAKLGYMASHPLSTLGKVTCIICRTRRRCSVRSLQDPGRRSRWRTSTRHLFGLRRIKATSRKPRSPDSAGAVVWYGCTPSTTRTSRPVPPGTDRFFRPQRQIPFKPTGPIDHVKDLKVPVIGFYGGLDKGITQDAVNKMKDALKAQNSKSEINVYPNADHGFFADYRPSYNKEAADDAWPKLLAWFRKTERLRAS